MKILAIDISGRVVEYDESLYASIAQNLSSKDSFAFNAPTSAIAEHCKSPHLYSLIPSRYRFKSFMWKKFLKVLEGIINYIIIHHFVRKENIDILHIQWLPFLEFCNFEYYWVKHLKRACPKVRVIVTWHNIYPHNISDKKKIAYKKRVTRIVPFIDAWIVHTKNAAERMESEYGIESSCMHVIHHGVFVPALPIPERHRDDDKIRFLLFASQSFYKGTDIMIEAMELLPLSIKEKIDVRIMGGTAKSLYLKYADRAAKEHIIWENRHISDMELMQAIQDSDALVFPYRTITQSGALLTGLFFKKPMLVSNLPAFVETLGDEYPKALVFEKCNASSLANAITQFITNPINHQTLEFVLQHLVSEYSWDNAAKKTINLYNEL